VEDGWHGRIVSGVKCEQCGDPLPATARRNRRYCDQRCRRRAHEERHAPAAPELAPVVPVAASTGEEHVQELLARVLAEERLVAQVAAGAKTNWRASAWLLERRFPERWAAMRRPETEPELPADPDDPFSEVDALAAKRRARRERPK
jgi:hypothetical protein